MWNADLEAAICKPEAEAEAFYRNGDGDELFFVHEGSGKLETVFGTVPFTEHDYIYVPRGTTYRFSLDSTPQLWLVFHTPGEVETPNRYRNRYGQLLESAPYSQRDFHPPGELVTHREGGDHELVVRVRGGLQHYALDYHPFDIVGWDGYVYPYTFNVHDFEPRTGRLHLPPPTHQTFQGPNFVICSFCPRELDYDPRRCRFPTITRTCTPRRSSTTSPGSSGAGRESRWARSPCTRRGFLTDRSPGSSRRRSERGAPRSWR